MTLPIRVLLVEESRDDKRLFHEALTNGGLEPRITRVDTAAAFREALYQGAWDLILADYSLPQFGGIQALEILRESRFDIPFLIVSGEAGEAAAVEAMRAGAHDYILKGNLARLAPAVRRELQEVAVRQENRQALEALEASERQFRAIVGTLPDLAYVFDCEGRILEVLGRSAADVCETDPSLLKGKHLSAIWPREVAQRAEEVIAQTLESGTVQILEYDFDCGGTRRWFEGRTAVLQGRLGHLPGVLWVARDITERKRAIEEKHRLEAQLVEAHKMEALGSLAGGIAHDFNNLLTAILGNVELAQMDEASPEHVSNALGEILRAGNRARELVQQILTFSRQNAVAHRAIAFEPVLTEAVQTLRAMLPSNVRIDLGRMMLDLAILGDETQVHQVVMNLATNAAHAMQEQGGIIRIEQQVVEASPELLAIYPHMAAGWHLRLTVSDTGTGIDAATMARIFEPFFSTKGPAKGTGLGLAVVQSIMQQHRGAITVQSKRGVGTTFQIYFPLADGAPTTKPTGIIKRTAIRGHRERILAVDDEPAVGALASRLAEHLGYRPTYFSDPVEALAEFRRQPEQFDIAMLDLSMPGMNGIELSQAIHQVRPELPILLVTGHTGGLDPRQAKEFGVRDILMKPFNSQSLGERLHRLLKNPVFTCDAGLETV